MDTGGPSGPESSNDFKESYERFVNKLEYKNRKQFKSIVQPSKRPGAGDQVIFDTLARVIACRHVYIDTNTGTRKVTGDVCVALYVDDSKHRIVLRIANNNKTGLETVANKRMETFSKWANAPKSEENDRYKEIRKMVSGEVTQMITELKDGDFENLGPDLRNKVEKFQLQLKTEEKHTNGELVEVQLEEILIMCLTQYKSLVDKMGEDCWKHRTNGKQAKLIKEILSPCNDALALVQEISQDTKIGRTIRSWKPDVLQIANDNQEGTLHAEMRILQYIYENNNKTFPKRETIGLSKLCCGACELAIQVLNENLKGKKSGAHINTPGTHAKFYKDWRPPGWLLDSDTMLDSYKKALDISPKIHYSLTQRTGMGNMIKLTVENLRFS